MLLKKRIRENIKKFSVRKIILAISDMFIIAVSALIANFVLTPFSLDLSTKNLAASIIYMQHLSHTFRSILKDVEIF